MDGKKNDSDKEFNLYYAEPMYFFLSSSNGAAQYGPAAILVIASAIVAKISLF